MKVFPEFLTRRNPRNRETRREKKDEKESRALKELKLSLPFQLTQNLVPQNWSMSIPIVWFWSILTHLRSTGEQALVRNWIVHSSTTYSTALDCPDCNNRAQATERSARNATNLSRSRNRTVPDCLSTLRHARRREQVRPRQAGTGKYTRATERKPTIQHTRHPQPLTSELFQACRRRHWSSVFCSSALCPICTRPSFALLSRVSNSLNSEVDRESLTSIATVTRGSHRDYTWLWARLCIALKLDRAYTNVFWRLRSVRPETVWRQSGNITWKYPCILVRLPTTVTIAVRISSTT